MRTHSGSAMYPYNRSKSSSSSSVTYIIGTAKGHCDLIVRNAALLRCAVLCLPIMYIAQLKFSTVCAGDSCGTYTSSVVTRSIKHSGCSKTVNTVASHRLVAAAALCTTATAVACGSAHRI
jgi:hypothetical protein